MLRTTTLVAVALSLLAGMAVAPASAAKKEKRIKPQVFLEYNKLPAGGKCRVVMEIQVEKGWHIYANPAGQPNLIATEFKVKSSGGIKLTDVKYPKHQVLNVDGIGSANVYEGKIQIAGTLEVPASAAGKVDELQLQIRYQPCDDFKCEAPTTDTIEGKIPVVADASGLKKINPKYFD